MCSPSYSSGEKRINEFEDDDSPMAGSKDGASFQKKKKAKFGKKQKFNKNKG